MPTMPACAAIANSTSERAAVEAGSPPPNVDYALAALSAAIGLRRGAATTIFTVARSAGLLAHALEEYPHRLRFRPRATYVGAPPRGR